MVNRILIRIKVVQMLYAYLLTRSEFKIDATPDGTSRDRRFAYTVYLDMLLLISELSGCNLQQRQLNAIVPSKLAANRVGKALAETDILKSTLLKGTTNIQVLRPAMPGLLSVIEQNPMYQEYSRKRKTDLDIDVRLWVNLLTNVIAKDPEVDTLLRTTEEYTTAGFEAGVKRAVATLEAYNDTRAAYNSAKADLQKSLDKAYELYFGIFQLIIDLTRAAQERQETAKAKFLATHEDLNPDTKFVDNELVRRLERSEEMREFAKKHNLDWADEPALIRTLLDRILESKPYQDYMATEERSFESDCNLWRTLLKYVIFPSDALADELETRSIFWNDDLEIMSTFVLKTLGQIARNPEEEEIHFLPQYKDDEDAAFGAELFHLAVEHRELYRSYIDKFINSDQWDPERLAFMDIVIMICAIAELIHYPNIPVPVTLNEYIEIANAYSTQRSGQFINGLLYSIVNYLKEEKIIDK